MLLLEYLLVIVYVRERRIHDGVGGDVETVGHARREDDEQIEHQGEVDEHEAPGEEVALLLYPLDVPAYVIAGTGACLKVPLGWAYYSPSACIL